MIRVSPSEFEALRARGLKAVAFQRRAPAIAVPRARTAVPRKIPAENAVYIHKSDPSDTAQHSIKATPGKVMAADLSMAKTGLAWGKPGELPEGTVCLCGHKDAQNEGERLLGMAKAVAWWAASKNCGVVIFSEFYSAKNMLAFRANVALRGAVMAELTRHGIQAIPVPEITARKAAGVDVRKRQDYETKGYMKTRVAARLEALGMGALQEDEGDATIVLLGAKAVIDTSEQKP
jgi:hypothetical protein